MSALIPSGERLRNPELTQRLGAILFAAAGIAIVVLFFLFPGDAAHGWLLAFVVFSQVGLGALALILIDTLTSTSWGRAFAPLLRNFLWAIPLVALFWVPIAVNLGRLYPWAGSPRSIPNDVASLYLSAGPFLLRSLIALAGWTFLAALLLRGPIARLTAGLGLTFFGLSSYVFGFDWLLSIGAPFISSSFFAEIAIQSILAALAVLALFAPGVRDQRARADVGALMLTGSLAVFYFSWMTLIVLWYGDLPEQAQWYLDRLGPWLISALAAIIFGAAIPIMALLWSAVRNSGIALRLIGISVLCGIIAHNVWLLSPILGALALVCALAAAIAMSGLMVLVVSKAASHGLSGRPHYV